MLCSTLSKQSNAAPTVEPQVSHISCLSAKHTSLTLAVHLFSVCKQFKYVVEKEKKRVFKSNKKRIAGGQQSECLYAQVIR